MGIPPEGIQIDVQLDGLKDLAEQIRKMTQRDLAGQYDAARPVLDNAPPPFGTKAVMKVVAAEREMHKAAARQMLVTLDGYRRQALALAAAIDSIVKEYGEADAATAAQTRDIDAGYVKALNDMKPAAGPKPAAPRAPGREAL